LSGQLTRVCSTSPSYLCTVLSHKSFLIAIERKASISKHAIALTKKFKERDQFAPSTEETGKSAKSHYRQGLGTDLPPHIDAPRLILESLFFSWKCVDA